MSEQDVDRAIGSFCSIDAGHQMAFRPSLLYGLLILLDLLRLLGSECRIADPVEAQSGNLDASALEHRAAGLCDCGLRRVGVMVTAHPEVRDAEAGNAAQEGRLLSTPPVHVVTKVHDNVDVIELGHRPSKSESGL